jgi:hypothetical protein
MFESVQNNNNSESRAEHLQAAAELAAEVLPQLETEFPLAYDKLQNYLETGFTDPSTGEELDAGEILSKIQDVMEQRANFDQASFSRTMEALAQGMDPDTGEPIYADKTRQ